MNRISAPPETGDSGSSPEGTDSHPQSGFAPTFFPEEPDAGDVVGRLKSRIRGPELRGLPGKALGGFWLVRQLVHAGQEPVYQAEAIDGSGPVALRLMPVELVRDAVKLDELRRRIGSFSGLTCPEVVKRHGLQLAGGQPFIVEEFVSGESLASRLMRKGRLDGAAGQSVAFQVARAVEAIHAAGLVHGDIRPENVLLVAPRNGESGSACQVKLSAFGLDGFFAAPAPAPLESGKPSGLTTEVWRESGPKLSRGPVQSDIHDLGLTLAAVFLGLSDRSALASALKRPHWANKAALDLARSGLSPSLTDSIVKTWSGGEGAGRPAAQLACELEEQVPAARMASELRERAERRGPWARLWNSLWRWSVADRRKKTGSS